MKQINLRPIDSTILMTFALLFAFGVQANAQKKDYKPGEKIEYRAETYPKEIWEVGVFVSGTPDGRQPIIREKPNEFNKEGFQRGSQWAEIRPLSAKTASKTPVDETGPDDNKNAPTTTTDFGTGLMSKEDVLSFLQTKLGDNPFRNPRLDAIKKELAEMIKQRGLDFRYSETSPDFFGKLAKYGAITSEVSFPLRDNYGEPTEQRWLLGTWKLGKIGASVDYVRNNRVYRQGEIGVANVGTLTLNANGTYSWKAGAKDSTSGKWREATGAEMKSKGGDGIVLFKAKSGYDWIVTKDRTTTLKGEWLNISELGTRQINEYGSRAGKK